MRKSRRRRRNWNKLFDIYCYQTVGTEEGMEEEQTQTRMVSPGLALEQTRGIDD